MPRLSSLIATALLLTLTACRAVIPEPLTDPTARLQQAMQQVAAVTDEWKTGATRADLNRDFRPDGGLNGHNPQRYVYRAYSGVKIDVEFEFANPDAKPGDKDYWNNPRDKVKAVSKPYAEHPIFD